MLDALNASETGDAGGNKAASTTYNVGSTDYVGKAAWDSFLIALVLLVPGIMKPVHQLVLLEITLEIPFKLVVLEKLMELLLMVQLTYIPFSS